MKTSPAMVGLAGVGAMALLCHHHWLNIPQGKQAAETTIPLQGEHDHPISRLVHTYMYKVGAPCYTLYCFPKQNRQPRWIPTIVTKVFST